uniref:MACPF domain-containing protein n=1 Tax=Corethron hystrix TaxID=216773 RepID=A0A7S1BSS8_9STRA|mmetsp:Transcript_38714/g.89996  ORF Transcript_38714/g.89996 Transcript_38714/m.89996 type:complete len:449 (+) Transcript_38714:111-1457(+)
MCPNIMKPFLGFIYLAVSCCLKSVRAAGSIVTDGIAGNKDRTPVLGRGYSTATGDLMSSCLIVPVATEPSYGYEYTFTSFSSSFASVNSSSGAERSEYERKSSGWSRETRVAVRNQVQSDSSRSSRENKKYMVASMKADLYYNSVDEGSSIFSNDAMTVLSRGDFIGFLQSCGPNYIRSIRRSKELTAVFSHNDSSTQSSEGVNSSLEVAVTDITRSTKCSFLFRCSTRRSTSSSSFATENQRKLTKKSFTASLEIKIYGFGLRFYHSSIGTLVAKSFNDYDQVMSYGFDSMLHPSSGVVQSIEIVPWASYPDFYVAAKLDVVLEKDQCFTLISRTCSGIQCRGENDSPVDCNNYCYVSLGGVYNLVDCDDGVTCGAEFVCKNEAGAQIAFTYADSTNEICTENNIYNSFARNDNSFLSEPVMEMVSCDTEEVYSTEQVIFFGSVEGF